ncbi:nuclear transport factor 2 family protein [Terricaulis sp.]|uniref:nuclear transport factor 2 family protein n=1 Tax=Terricaulis sp. TaxID=2768686 RepID=UPI002AC6678A|nr:nuclear transport factor 2 family protein [Terricaulis sp.]MDZ4691115.1 nuclear transport factor 2 family protein [Terricaulis sp.]
MSNTEPVRALYAAFAKGDMPAALATMAPDIVWNEAENYPYADRNPYVGPEAVLMGVFARIGGDWDDFAAVPDEFIDGGDTIVSLGHYSGTHKATGKPMRAQFAHVCRVKNGKIAAFQQYADTLGTWRATQA